MIRLKHFKNENVGGSTDQTHYSTQGIAGLLNPDCNPIWWIGLWLTIQSQKWILDLNCQSSFVISIQIQNIELFYQEIKFS